MGPGWRLKRAAAETNFPISLLHLSSPWKYNGVVNCRFHHAFRVSEQKETQSQKCVSKSLRVYLYLLGNCPNFLGKFPTVSLNILYIMSSFLLTLSSDRKHDGSLPSHCWFVTIFAIIRTDVPVKLLSPETYFRLCISIFKIWGSPWHF